MLYLKRYFAAAAAILVLLTGCRSDQAAREQVQESLSTPFSTTAKLRYNGVDAEVQITGEGEGKCYTLCFTDPPSLRDIQMKFTEEKVNVAYKGMSFGVKPEALTDGMAGEILMETIRSAFGGEDISVECGDGIISICGRINNGDFTLRLDRTTGNFLSLDLPDNDFYMEFSGFEFYQ